MDEKDVKTLVHVEGCSKSFSGVTVFDNVSFELKAGEIHSLCGENGAGKSTFIKILSGAYVPDSGRIFICGKEINYISCYYSEKNFYNNNRNNLFIDSRLSEQNRNCFI